MTPARELRIAIVAPYDLSAPGGINTQIRAQARALRRLGHDVRIYGPASGPLGQGEQSLGRTMTVTLGGTESGLGVDPRVFGAAGRLMREPFDIVHVHEPLTPLAPWIVVLRAQAPVVGTFHVHREAGHGLYAAWAWTLRPIARRIRARIAVSESARRTVARHFPGEYEILPNGIEADRFLVPCSRPSSLAGARRYVLYVGRLEPRKGVAHLVRAMPAIQRRVADVMLAVVGDGPDRVALTQLARDVGAAVHFAGRVPDEALPAYFQAAEVVCAPALGGESFGIVLLEAMASGTPVVASRIEGYEALAGRSECAKLVPPGDADALATAAIGLLESEERRRMIRAEAIALARQYDWQTLAPRLESIYRRVQGGTASTVRER
jgi:phosphatidylinositol alpha-mannosyltransferase